MVSEDDSKDPLLPVSYYGAYPGTYQSCSRAANGNRKSQEKHYIMNNKR